MLRSFQYAAYVGAVRGGGAAWRRRRRCRRWKGGRSTGSAWVSAPSSRPTSSGRRARRSCPPRRRSGTHSARLLPAREGDLRAGLRAQQPSRLGADPAAGHPSDPGRGLTKLAERTRRPADRWPGSTASRPPIRAPWGTTSRPARSPCSACCGPSRRRSKGSRTCPRPCASGARSSPAASSSRSSSPGTATPPADRAAARGAASGSLAYHLDLEGRERRAQMAGPRRASPRPRRPKAMSRARAGG